MSYPRANARLVIGMPPCDGGGGTGQRPLTEKQVWGRTQQGHGQPPGKQISTSSLGENASTPCPVSFSLSFSLPSSFFLCLSFLPLPFVPSLAVLTQCLLTEWLDLLVGALRKQAHPSPMLACQPPSATSLFQVSGLSPHTGAAQVALSDSFCLRGPSCRECPAQTPGSRSAWRAQ